MTQAAVEQFRKSGSRCWPERTDQIIAVDVEQFFLVHAFSLHPVSYQLPNLSNQDNAPGATVTERTLQEADDYEQTWAALTPSRRPAYVRDIAAAVLFLASVEARQINGQALIIDGGWTISSPMPGYVNH